LKIRRAWCWLVGHEIVWRDCIRCDFRIPVNCATCGDLGFVMRQDIAAYVYGGPRWLSRACPDCAITGEGET
jgi:hypothetical protein